MPSIGRPAAPPRQALETTLMRYPTLLTLFPTYFLQASHTLITRRYLLANLVSRQEIVHSFRILLKVTGVLDNGSLSFINQAVDQTEP
jgi:hypothetical protein